VSGKRKKDESLIKRLFQKRIKPRGLHKAASAMIAVLGAVLLTLGLSGAPALATGNGNNGTLKIHEQGTPSGTEDNDPKVCVFNVEGFGFDAGQSGYLYFDVQGGDGPTGTPAGPFDFGPTNGDGYYATQYFNLDPGHYKATLYGKPGREDEKAKSKVFKVECEEPPTEVPVPSQETVDPCNPQGVTNNVAWKDPLPTDTANVEWSESNGGATRTATLVGDNVEWSDGTTAPKVFNLPADSGEECEAPEPEGELHVSKACESITIGMPTGVKPEGAQVVIKLDNVSVVPDTYPATPGSHTVELFVNGEKVDSETFVVEECPEEPVPAKPTVSASSDACVKPGEATGVVDVMVTNTDDETDDTVIYDVTLDGTTKQVTIADGQSGSVQFTGLASGTYTVSVTGDDDTSASTTVKVKECEVPPSPAEPTVQAAAQGCVDQGSSNGVVDVMVANTDDETDETVTYQVTLNGRTQSVTIADGQSGSVQFTGLASGTYTVSVVGDDETSASTTVTVKECEVSPVYNPSGHVETGCAGNARFVMDNRESNQPVWFEVVVVEQQTSSINLVEVKAGDREVTRLHSLKPGTVLTLRALDVQLDREVVPGKCGGDNPPPDNPDTPDAPDAPDNPTFDTGLSGQSPDEGDYRASFRLVGLLMLGLAAGMMLIGSPTLARVRRR